MMRYFIRVILDKNPVLLDKNKTIFDFDSLIVMGALPPNPHVRHVAEGQDKPAPHAQAYDGIF